MRRLSRARAAARRALAPAALALGAAVGCASQGAPPGGPEDALPPQVLRIVPDTGAVNARPSQVVFRFDEVVSERPQGAATLAGLFLISPRDGEPRVDWDRDAIEIRPRRGWRRNTVYTVTMLPGLVDLRGNVRRDGAVAVFSTGPEIPDTRLTGVVYDWVEGRPTARAFAEARPSSDTTVVYVTAADSSGRFVFPHLPAGAYRVRGYADANNNRALDPREQWDTAGVTLRDTASAQLLAFVHDTVGPRVQTVTVADTVTLRLDLDRPMHPDQELTTALFSVVDADSARLPILRVLSAAAYDVRQRAADSAAAARGDTTRADTARPPAPAAPPSGPTGRRAAAAAADSARRAAELYTGPRPVARVVVELGSPLRPGASYRVESRGLRGLLGATATSSRAFTTERAAPRDTTRAPGDTARTRPDSTRRPPARRPR